MNRDYNRMGRAKGFATFALIPLFAFAVVVVVPFLGGVLMAFTDWNGFSDSFRFMGWHYFHQAFSDPKFWHSLAITTEYVIVTLVLTNLVAFGLALLVTSRLRGKHVFRLGFFTPNLIGGIILGFIWQFIFARVFVYVGKALDWEIFSASWLADPELAFWTLVIVGVWQSSGYMMLIYTAGLMGIPDELLEAAQLDGANARQRLWRIKIPLMMPAFTISLFLTLQRGFMVYDTNLSLTRGGPFRSTELISMHVYNEAFLYQNLGPGQAKAMVLFAIVALIALIQVGVMKRMEVESG